LYNQCLEKKSKLWEEEETSVSAFDMIKSEIPAYKGKANYSAMQQTVRRLGKAFDRFFKAINDRKKGIHTPEVGYPRFKKASRFNTIEFATLGDGCKVHDDVIYLQHIGKVKVKKHRQHPKAKTISVTRRGDKYWVNLHCEVYQGNLPRRETSVGIDFGIKTTVTLSTGEKITTPYFIKEKQRQIARLNRRENYKALKKVHAKIANKRKDWNHKLSRRLVSEFDVILIENFQVEEVTSFTPVNTKLYNSGIRQLINFILYKAESAGGYATLVDPAYTTQTCVCGKLNKLTLAERTYACECGYVADRDTHAANNIKTRGLASLELSCS
jgi:putative transposase